MRWGFIQYTDVSRRACAWPGANSDTPNSCAATAPYGPPSVAPSQQRSTIDAVMVHNSSRPPVGIRLDDFPQGPGFRLRHATALLRGWRAFHACQRHRAE